MNYLRSDPLLPWTSLLEAALISCPAGLLRAATPLSQTTTLTEIYSKIPRLARVGILGNSTRTLSCFLSFIGLSLKAGPRSTRFWVNFLFSMVVKSLSWSETKMASSPGSANYLENGTNEPVSTSGGGFNELTFARIKHVKSSISDSSVTKLTRTL